MKLLATTLMMMALAACGGAYSHALGESCDPTGYSDRPPPCVDSLVCTGAFENGDMCVKLYSNGGCLPSEDSYTTPSRVIVCFPRCTSGCMSGWTCASGVCVPPH
jgi:hypothetical protein